jgi:ribose transport system substrate-binding protein
VHPFFEPVTEMAVAYGRSRGVRIIARGPESTDVRQQMQIMESLIAERVDGIALCATDPDALAPLADRAIAAGIPTIAFESDMPRSRRLCFLGTDNYKAGRHLAEVLARELGGRGRALICTGLPTQMSLHQRIQGIRDTLRERYPGVRIVDLRTGKGDPELTLAVIEEQITRFPDFDSFTSIDATGGRRPWRSESQGLEGRPAQDRHLRRHAREPGGHPPGSSTCGFPEAVDLGAPDHRPPADLDRRPQRTDYYDTGTVEITRVNVDSYRR